MPQIAQIVPVRVLNPDGRKPAFDERKTLPAGVLGKPPHRLSDDPLELPRINGKYGCWIVTSPDGFKGEDGGVEPRPLVPGRP